MTLSRPTPSGDRIIEPMIALAHCSKQDRIVVAGFKGGRAVSARRREMNPVRKAA